MNLEFCVWHKHALLRCAQTQCTRPWVHLTVMLPLPAAEKEQAEADAAAQAEADAAAQAEADAQAAQEQAAEVAASEEQAAQEAAAQPEGAAEEQKEVRGSGGTERGSCAFRAHRMHPAGG